MKRRVFQHNAVHGLEANPVGIISAVAIFDAIPESLNPGAKMSLVGAGATHPRETAGSLCAQDGLKSINTHLVHPLSLSAIDPQNSVQAFQAADLALTFGVHNTSIPPQARIEGYVGLEQGWLVQKGVDYKQAAHGSADQRASFGVCAESLIDDGNQFLLEKLEIEVSTTGVRRCLGRSKVSVPRWGIFKPK